MGSIAEYCNILGVKPGDSPETIKKAFRERIKTCHPDRARAEGVDMGDRARLIIEAYNALRDGVPNEYTATGGHTHDPHQAQSRDYTYRTAKDYYTRYRNPGEDIFKNVFGAGGEKLMEKLREALRNDPDLLRQFGIDPDLYKSAGGAQGGSAGQRSQRSAGSGAGGGSATGSAAAGRFSQKPSRPSLAGATPEAKEEYLDADDFLKQVVKRYTRMKQHRARRPWARDYIRDLNQVMIMFRSVARKNPTVSSAALFRVREVHELINQVRSMIA